MTSATMRAKSHCLGKAAWLLMIGFMLAGCGVGPQRTIYVLGDPPAPTAFVASEVGLPIVLVKSVELPDYLDSTDLQERHGDEVVASRTGIWGERLSVGITRALAGSLATRLPRMAMTVTSSIERPALQVLVNLDEFEPRVEGPVLLVGRWNVTDGTAQKVMISERISLAEPVVGKGDAATVAAMTRAIDRLADHIAEGITAVHATS